MRADFPANNFAEFIRYVKANPGKVNYASSGNGSLQHVTTELLKDLTKSGWGCCVRAANIKADRSFS